MDRGRGRVHDGVRSEGGRWQSVDLLTIQAYAHASAHLPDSTPHTHTLWACAGTRTSICAYKCAQEAGNDLTDGLCFSVVAFTIDAAV